MTTEIKVAVIGLRNIGKNHIRKAMHLKNIRVTTGVDTDPARTAEAKDELDLHETFTSADKFFEQSNCDAVVLALPNHLHLPFTLQAFDAGMDVLVEKPIARNTDEARQMLQARDKSRKTLMVGMNQRFQTRIHALRRLVQEGELGVPYYARTWWNRIRPGDGLWARGDWFLSPELSGGGPLIDLGIHKLDLTLHLMGFPKPVSVDGSTFNTIGDEYCRQKGRKWEVEDMGVGMVRLENGAMLHLEAAYFHNTAGEESAGQVLHFSKGCIEGQTLWMADDANEALADIQYEEDAAAPQSCIEHFRNVLMGEEPLSSTAEEGLLGLRIIEAIYESSEKGKAITL
ncbi:MAG: Gfo/Idh/MocA family protein [Candidatus Sumerlaeota bacterium]